MIGDEGSEEVCGGRGLECCRSRSLVKTHWSTIPERLVPSLNPKPGFGAEGEDARETVLMSVCPSV